MHVVVITKNTPDTAAMVTVDAEGNADWGQDLVVNPWDEYAITEAVLLKGEHKVKATVITLGGDEQADALKHGLAVGCDHAIRVWDDALAEADSLAYARAIAAAITKLGDVDLVIFGKELSDIAADAHIFQVARTLGWNALGFVAQIEAIDFNAKTIRVKRQAEAGMQVAASSLPAVISVIKDINKPKYPTLIGIRKAGKVDVPVWSLSDLGLNADAVQSQTQQTGYRELPKREGSAEIIDGSSVQEQAQTLVEKLLEDKVI